MVYQLRLSAVAKAGLAKESRYSHRHWGRRHAQSYVAALKAKIVSLKTDAKLYAVHDSEHSDIRVMTYKGNRVVYALDEAAGRVTVLAVTSIYQSVDPGHS